MDPTFNLTNYIDARIAQVDDKTTLELYSEDELLRYHENHTFEEIVVPSPVEVFVNELNTRRIVAPPTLRVIDHMPFMTHPLEFNIPDSLEMIILHNVNIQKKQFIELFKPGISYTYKNCLLDGVPLNEIVISLYKECSGGEEPRYSTHRLYNQPLTKNSISRLFHAHIIAKILQHQQIL
jgi:hypothetical protein